MKVAVIYTSTYPPVNGPISSDRRVRDIARGIARDNKDVSLIIPRWHYTGAQMIDHDINLVDIGSFVDKINLLNRIIFWIKAALYLIKNRFKCVVLYSPTIDSILLISILRISKISVVMEISDLMSHSLSGSLKGFFHLMGERILPRFCNYILPISNHIKNSIAEYHPKAKQIILPILVDSDNFSYSTKTNKFLKENCNLKEENIVIGYIGGMYKIYGIALLYKAIAILKKKGYSQVKLVVGGKLNGNDEIIDSVEMVNKLSLNHEVHLLGWLNTKQVIDTLSICDIMVVPHLDTPFNNAGLPTKLAEYSAMRKAIVCTKLGDIPNYFEDKINAILIAPNSVDELVNNLEVLILNKKYRDKIGENAFLVFQKHFDYLNVGQLLAPIFKK